MADYKLISADSHVNEVAATWERVRRKYGERTPEIVWNPSEEERGPYLSIRDWETSLEGKNRESCAMEFLGMMIGGLGVGNIIGRTSSKATEFRKDFRFERLARALGTKCPSQGHGPRWSGSRYFVRKSPATRLRLELKGRIFFSSHRSFLQRLVNGILQRRA